MEVDGTAAAGVVAVFEASDNIGVLLKSYALTVYVCELESVVIDVSRYVVPLVTSAIGVDAPSRYM